MFLNQTNYIEVGTLSIRKLAYPNVDQAYTEYLDNRPKRLIFRGMIGDLRVLAAIEGKKVLKLLEGGV